MKKIHKIMACCMIGSLTILGRPSVAKAAEIPIAGIDVLLHDLYQSNVNAPELITDYLLSETSSQFKDLSFAQVTSYVNIRSKASEEGEILGKLYNNSAATILESAGEWYKVKSGSVEGYIKGEFLITGQKASEMAKSLGTRVATVSTETLRVRQEANTDSSIVTLVPVGEELIVKKEIGDWIKVSVNNKDTGYVSADYVKLETIYEEAVSIQEEQERIASEEEAREALERSERPSNTSSRPSNSSNTGSSKQSTYKTESNSSNSSLRSKIVNYSVRFEGNPYVWGGTSLTNGADCSGFTQSVFEDYGIYIPRTSRSQAASGRRISLDNIRPGDLVFYAKYGTINHVAIYIGNGKVISASSPRTGIRITSLYYRQPVKAVSYID